MRVTVIAPGSRGDLQPYLALAAGLNRSGHQARLVTHEDFEDLVSSYGVDFWPVEGSVRQIAQSPGMRARLERGSFVAVLAQMAKAARRGALAMARGGLAACQGADLILAGLGGIFVGTALAEKFGIPLLQAYYIPLTPTAAFPSFLFPRLPGWLGSVLNRPSYHLARQMVWQGFRMGDRLARRQVLGLPPAPFWGPFDSEPMVGMPVLNGYSPRVIPRAPDWSPGVHVTGYWFLDPPGDWTPPHALEAFLDAGPTPVYVGFGSMSSRDPRKTIDLILKALGQVGKRAVLLSGWGGLHSADLPESVYLIDSIPFSWLFPRVAAVVHHGGAGTTAEALRAGVPSIVVPFFGDQFYWGQRVAALGVGPEPLPRKKLRVEGLAQAIRRATADQVMGERAAQLGRQIRAEDGVAAAVAVIDRLG